MTETSQAAGAVIAPQRLENLFALAGSALDIDSFRPRNDALSRICEYAQSQLGSLEALIRVKEDDTVLVISGTATHDRMGDYDAVMGIGDETLSSASYGQRSPSIEVFSSGLPMFVRDADMDPGLPAGQRLRRLGVRCSYYCPIVRQGMVIGVLAIFWGEDRRLGEEELLLISALARIAAIAAMTSLFAEQIETLRRGSEELSEQYRSDNAHLRKIQSAQSRMIQILSEEPALAVEQIAGVLSSAFNCAVLITDTEQQELAYSGRPTLAERMRRVAIAGLAGEPEPEEDGHGALSCTLLPLSAPGTHAGLGNVVLAPEIDPKDEVGGIMLRQVVLALSAHLEARRTDRALSTAMLPVSLLALSRDLFSRALRKESATQFGVTRDTRLGLAILVMPTPEAALRLSRARSVFEASEWPCMTAVADGNDVLVLLRGGPVDARAAQRLMASQPQVAQIGFSAVFRGLEAIPNGFREARVAKGLAPSTGGFAFYDVLGAFADITGSMSLDQMEAFVSSTLGSVMRYDRERNAELLETLKVFAENNGRAPETARAMSIHVNTLHKRLARIQEITGMDLHSFQDLSRVLLALDIMPTLVRLEVRIAEE